MENKNAYDIVAIKKGAENPTKNFNMEFDPSRSALFSYKEENKTMEELKKEFYEEFTEPLFTQEGKVLFRKYPDEVWQWIEQNFRSKQYCLRLIKETEEVHNKAAELKAENEKLGKEYVLAIDAWRIEVAQAQKDERDRIVKIIQAEDYSVTVIGDQSEEPQQITSMINNSLNDFREFLINTIESNLRQNTENSLRNEPSCRKCRHVSRDPHTMPCVSCTHNAIKEIFVRSYYQPKER